jgi:hypothetical protein
MTKPTLVIFSHGKIIGATTDIANGTFINDPKNPLQLGCAVDVKHVIITAEAKALIKGCVRSGGSFGLLMLTEHADPSGEFVEASVSVFGKWIHMFDTSGPLLGRDCDLSVLDKIEVDYSIEIPKEFISAALTLLEESGSALLH